MAKLDGRAMLAEAEQTGQLYRVKPGWKKYMIFAGVLMCLLILTIPLGIWFFLIAGKARLGITDQGFAIKWFTTQSYAWEDLGEFRSAALSMHVSGGGLVGALAGAAASAAVAAKTQGLKGPLQFKLKGKRAWRQIPAHALENSVAMAKEMEKRSGLQIFPPDAA